MKYRKGLFCCGGLVHRLQKTRIAAAMQGAVERKEVVELAGKVAKRLVVLRGYGGGVAVNVMPCLTAFLQADVRVG